MYAALVTVNEEDQRKPKRNQSSSSRKGQLIFKTTLSYHASAIDRLPGSGGAWRKKSARKYEEKVCKAGEISFHEGQNEFITVWRAMKLFSPATHDVDER